MSNNPSPNPRGSTFEQAGQRKSNLPVIVLIFLAFHAVVLGGILIVGCKKGEAPPDTAAPVPKLSPISATTNEESFFPSLGTPAPIQPLPSTPPSPVTSTDLTPGPAPMPAPMPAPLPGPTPVPAPTPALMPAPVPAGPPPAAKTHTVARGDTFYGIAKEHGVSMKDIQDANPGVDPKKLKVGQKLTVPPPSPKAAGSPAAPLGRDVYVVKSGDTLGKIARTHGTTVERLREVNGLQTDRILVGRKLKLPPEAK